MWHLNKDVSKATVIDFTHIKVPVHPLVKRQLVTVITCNRYKPVHVIVLITYGMAGIHLIYWIRSILSEVVARRTLVVVLSVIQSIFTHKEDIVNASAVATALPVDVDTRVFPWVNLTVLVQVFYGV